MHGGQIGCNRRNIFLDSRYGIRELSYICRKLRWAEYPAIRKVFDESTDRILERRQVGLQLVDVVHKFFFSSATFAMASCSLSHLMRRRLPPTVPNHTTHLPFWSPYPYPSLNGNGHLRDSPKCGTLANPTAVDLPLADYFVLPRGLHLLRHVIHDRVLSLAHRVFLQRFAWIRS